MAEAGTMFSDGKVYERMMGRWSRIAGATFIDWLDQPGQLRWLDSGCGNGAFTEEILARCAPASVAAVDPSEGQIAFARTRPAAQKASFAIGDAQKLDFPDNSFDVAIMALVIAFLPDPAKAAAEMARVVKPGGWVATYMWNFEKTPVPGGPKSTPIAPVAAALRSLGYTPQDPPNVPASTCEAMRGFWEGAGLTAVETRTITVPVVYDSLDDLWDSAVVPIGPAGPIIAKLTAAERERLRGCLKEQVPVDANGRISFSAVTNAVKGQVPA